MALRRKARLTGDSLSVVIPAQLAELHGIGEGTVLEFQPMQTGVFKLVSLTKTCRARHRDTGNIVTLKLRNGECVPPAGYEVVR